MQDPDPIRPEGFRRVSAALRAKCHQHQPVWLEVAARTSQEAADALGVSLGQIAKSVVFRRKSDLAAVLVITSGDRRVDEKKLKQHTGPLGRADAVRQALTRRAAAAVAAVSAAYNKVIAGSAISALEVEDSSGVPCSP